MPDYLHLSRKGYEIWAQAIEDKLSAILGDARESIVFARVALDRERNPYVLAGAVAAMTAQPAVARRYEHGAVAAEYARVVFPGPRRRIA